MISGHMRAIALAVTSIITSISAASSAIAAPFDGEWSVLVQTTDHCGTSQWRLAIIGGQVHHPGVVFVPRPLWSATFFPLPAAVPPAARPVAQ